MNVTSLPNRRPDLPPAASAEPSPASLAHLPLPLFAVPMGLGGLGLAYREAGRVLGVPGLVGEALLLLAGLAWLVIAALHAIRAMRHPGSLAADLRHPIRAAFAGAVSIGLMIAAGGLIPHAPEIAARIWIVAVLVHLGIGIFIVRGLLRAPRDAATLTPPLLIPLVGNVLAPVFGVRLGFETASWLLFGIGALLWVLLQPSILHRVVTGPPLPERLRPTLAILLAPPAVGSLALAALTGGFGPAALAVFGLAAFIALVLLTMVGDFARVPFAMSWWGWTFPSAAFTAAVLGAAHAHSAPWQTPLLWTVLAAATAIVTLVTAATIREIRAGRLLLPEH
jgi:tellurite resistance protein